MALYEITENSLVPVDLTTFAAQGIRERSDLQRLLRENVGAIAPDTYVLAEEYGEWEDAKPVAQSFGSLKLCGFSLWMRCAGL